MEIRHQEQVLVGPSFVEIFFPTEEAPMVVGERSVAVALGHIVYVEFIGPVISPLAN